MKCVTNQPRGGFTLLELLLVVIILGVVAAVFVPQIGAGLSGARLATGARTVMQAARYARTMALLHQAETELVIGLKSGLVRIEAAGGTGIHAVAAGSGLPPESIRQEIWKPESLDGEGGRDTDITNRPAAAMTAQRFAEEIRAEFACEGIGFRFLGYDDTLDEAGVAVPDDEATECRIRFRSNGTCRPFALRVLIDDEEWMDVAFDVTGAGKVRDDAR
jgi:prepilin-type N-terminal cleavage/methylation domain-containing protein